jgi:hypothetical protein
MLDTDFEIGSLTVTLRDKRRQRGARHVRPGTRKMPVRSLGAWSEIVVNMGSCRCHLPWRAMHAGRYRKIFVARFRFARA